MNTIFVYTLILSISLLIYKDPSLVLDSLITGSTKAINLSIKLLAIYSVWLSILGIISSSKLDTKISRLLRPIITRLFPKENSAYNDISINITANVFGMGNACTPSGISAMHLLDRGTTYITASMAMLFILNVTSLELIPTTVIGLLLSHGCSNPYNIILPTLISTLASTLSGIVLVKIFSKHIEAKAHA